MEIPFHPKRKTRYSIEMYSMVFVIRMPLHSDPLEIEWNSK